VRPGDEGALLIRVLGWLLDELPEATRISRTPLCTTLGRPGTMSWVLSAEQESLVITLRAALATLATTLNGEREDPSGEAAAAALDGAEIVMRGESITGRVGRLPRLMPSLVFLVALPVVGQDRALALSLRTSELIAAEFGQVD
jgi:hypothetical protein